MAYASTRSQDVFWAQAAAEGHVWIPGPVAAGAFVDVCGPCDLMGPWKPCTMESEGHAELALPFADPGIAGPVLC